MEDAEVRLIAELLDMSHQAQRVVPKIGDPEHPTEWDLDHRRIDELLDRMREGA